MPTPKFSLMLTNHVTKTLTYEFTDLLDPAEIDMDLDAVRTAHAGDLSITTLCDVIQRQTIELRLPLNTNNSPNTELLAQQVQDEGGKAIGRAATALAELQTRLAPPVELGLEDALALPAEGEIVTA